MDAAPAVPPELAVPIGGCWGASGMGSPRDDNERAPPGRSPPNRRRTAIDHVLATECPGTAASGIERSGVLRVGGWRPQARWGVGGGTIVSKGRGGAEFTGA